MLATIAETRAAIKPFVERADRVEVYPETAGMPDYERLPNQPDTERLLSKIPTRFFICSHDEDVKRGPESEEVNEFRKVLLEQYRMAARLASTELAHIYDQIDNGVFSKSEKLQSLDDELRDKILATKPATLKALAEKGMRQQLEQYVMCLKLMDPTNPV